MLLTETLKFALPLWWKKPECPDENKNAHFASDRSALSYDHSCTAINRIASVHC
jgi:hypothetical protein